LRVFDVRSQTVANGQTRSGTDPREPDLDVADARLHGTRRQVTVAHERLAAIGQYDVLVTGVLRPHWLGDQIAYALPLQRVERIGGIGPWL
jgi:hypothetical protein